MRWRIALLLSVAIAISYLDRQALSVAVAAIQRDIPLTNVQFSHLQVAFLLAYAVMYAGGGALVDKLGTRRGLSADHARGRRPRHVRRDRRRGLRPFGAGRPERLIVPRRLRRAFGGIVPPCAGALRFC